MRHREPQRAGLEALEIVGVDELEALAERAAMLLDRHASSAGSGVLLMTTTHSKFG